MSMTWELYSGETKGIALKATKIWPKILQNFFSDLHTIFVVWSLNCTVIENSNILHVIYFPLLEEIMDYMLGLVHLPTQASLISR